MLRFSRRYSTLRLSVADPAMLLNDIAHRYASMPRVLMEFVDNAIDDAEGAYRNGGMYAGQGVHVTVLVDRANSALLVRDNCNGMDEDRLSRLISTVGQSSKKAVPWLNGRFGFGVHAFRAAAQRLTIRSKSPSSHLLLSLDRSLSEGISSPRQLSWPWTASDTGTEVLLTGIDPHYHKEMQIPTLCSEIELHFERLLTRPNLHIRVAEHDLTEHIAMAETDGDVSVTALSNNVRALQRCQPFDYGTVPGVQFRRDFELQGKTVNVDLVVAEKEYTGHKARFFSLGRRINEVSNVVSFLKESKHKQALWNHPQLIGFIDVPDCIEPVITRDEYKATQLRDELYRKLVHMEPDLKLALESVLEQYRTQSLTGFESTLGTVLDRLARQESKFQSQSPGSLTEYLQRGPKERAPTTDVEELDFEVTAKPKPTENAKTKVTKRVSRTTLPPKPKKSLFPVRFCEIPANDKGVLRRSQMVDQVIEINTIHPDFKQRLRMKHGKPVFEDRLAGYIATVISAHYRDKTYDQYAMEPARGRIYEDLVGTYAYIEASIRKTLPKLKRSLEQAHQG